MADEPNKDDDYGHEHGTFKELSQSIRELLKAAVEKANTGQVACPAEERAVRMAVAGVAALMVLVCDRDPLKADMAVTLLMGMKDAALVTAAAEPPAGAQGIVNTGLDN